MPTRIELHHGAAEDIRRLDRSVQARIRRTLYDLESLDDPRQRLAPYAENLKGYWKLRVGDFRLICELRRNDEGHIVLVIQVVHRGTAYSARNVRLLKRRAEDD